MKFIAAISLLSTAAAFAPAPVSLRTETSLNLWGEPNKKDGESNMSKALPFAPAPKLLDGSLAGDVGFE